VESQLVNWNREWQIVRSVLPASQDSSITYRKLVGQFYFQYGLLLVNSFGLQNALDNPSSKVDAAHFFARCHSAAVQCAVIVRDELVPRGFLRYSPDSHFVLISYAVLTLLKLSLSEFCRHMHNPERTVALVKDVAESLDKIAVGPQHTPALYATFLRALIDARPVQTPPQANSVLDGRGMDGVLGIVQGMGTGMGAGEGQEFSFTSHGMGMGMNTDTDLGAMHMSTDNLRHFDYGLGLGLDLDSTLNMDVNPNSLPGTGHARRDSNTEAALLSTYLNLNTVPETTLYQDAGFVFDQSNGLGLAEEMMAGFALASTGDDGNRSREGRGNDNGSGSGSGNGPQTPRPSHRLFSSSLGEMGPPPPPGSASGSGPMETSSFSDLQAHSAAAARGDLDANMISVDSILSPNFWDSILIPGFSSTFEGLSGGMVYGANGSGLITPRANSPGPS